MQWTHVICEKCWNAKNPNRIALTVIDGEEEICCFCGNKTKAGIFIREHPKNTPFCKCTNDD